MLVFSVSSLRKKLQIATKILMVALIIFLIVYIIKFTYSTFSETIVITEKVSAEDITPKVDEEYHYPGEPIRVSTDLDEYWQNKVCEIANQ